MLEVEMFAEGVVKQIKDYLPEKYKKMECEVVKQLKNNGVYLTGINFHMPGQNVSPTVYMESFYDMIRHGEPLNEVMMLIADTIERSQSEKNQFSKVSFDDFSSLKDYLRITLVNSNANWKMLTTMPHIEVEDLSGLFQVELPGEDGKEAGCMKVTNDMMDLWNVDREQLLSIAYQNMEKTNHTALVSIDDIMSEMISGYHPDNLLEQSKCIEENARVPMYVLSNERKSYGAASMICPGVMEKVDQLFPEGFYILPSSIHETLIIPKDGAMTPKELGEMVREVNRTEVLREEVLSDRVYEYDREKGKIRQVTESLEKARVMER